MSNQTNPLSPPNSPEIPDSSPLERFEEVVGALFDETRKALRQPYSLIGTEQAILSAAQQAIEQAVEEQPRVGFWTDPNIVTVNNVLYVRKHPITDSSELTPKERNDE